MNLSEKLNKVKAKAKKYKEQEPLAILAIARACVIQNNT
jgi:hypothetical protein